MDFVRPGLASDEEATLAARAAWLHYAGGRTQGEVAKLLGVPNSKAHRLIARASRDGVIRVFVEGPMAGCIALEEKLKDAYRLDICEVVPNIDEGPLPLRTLGMAGARYIRGLIERADYPLIGIGHGRTLSAAIDMLPSIDGGAVKFVSLLGGLTRRFAASPFDVIHRLAERTGAEAYVLPVPFFANTLEDKQVLSAQYGVRDVIKLTREAQLYFAGIGEAEPQSFISSSGMADPDDVAAVKASGAMAEMLGQFFSSEGRHIANPVSERAMAPTIADLEAHRIVALAGGTSKTRAIAAILRSGLLHGLVTDEATARRLVKAIPGTKPGKKNGKTASGTA